ncbi:Smr/MutS family protein [Polycladidibacter stylochi]|uniref:Smr/MutS family protein n=1 Tax=Polycladidibacter stylochi TaxID=1807766 RepID=UPI0008311BD9|nr:Smr/MutS family protein [Pseudovibrio stylochi]
MNTNKKNRPWKTLSKGDRELWHKVTSTLTPTKRDRVPFAFGNEVDFLTQSIPKASHDPKASLVNKSETTKATPKNGSGLPPYVPAKPDKPSAPPLSPLSRRERKKLIRSKGRSFDGRIDLHGMTQHQAYERLRGFLHQSQVMGHSIVLVITGKGYTGGLHHIGEGRGVLRRMVPQWLSLPDMRHYVIGYEIAHIKDGGEGALYVRIRRRKGTSRDYP